jgi:hypothetical protein
VFSPRCQLQIPRFARDDKGVDLTVNRTDSTVNSTMTDSRAFLRHTLATIAYRGAKAIRNAGPSFADYSCGETSRTLVRILAHIGDLMDWALSMAEGRREWKDSLPLPWEKECERFFAAVKKLDDYLASDKPLEVSAEKLFQGPIADALTHVGQIAMLRRMAGLPIKGESYFMAEVTVGRVGADQAAPRKEFD